MNLLSKKSLRNLGLSVLSAIALSACGGAGSCTNCSTSPTGAPSFSITAPTQYPAGVAVTAYLTMTNTSQYNATGLTYSVPAANTAGNNTGVTITINPNGANNNCASIAAKASCTFTATIPANSHPGSFTVTATYGGNTGNSAKLQTTSLNSANSSIAKSLQAGSISVTANLGLVNLPTTNNQFYILPSDWVVPSTSSEATTVYVSIFVQSGASTFDTLKLVDSSGTEINATLVGTLGTTANSVNTYKVVYPAGISGTKHIQAYSYTGTTPVCATLNTGTNDNTACSNDVDVILTSNTAGILSIQPNYFNLSSSYTSQVITLANTGSGKVRSITYPNWIELGSQFSITNNNCASLTKLESGQSCTMTLNYAANSTSGQITPVFSYDDDNNTTTVAKNTEIVIPYIGNAPATPFSVLSATPISVSLTAQNPSVVITVANQAGGSTAGVPISGWTLPTLAAPLELGATTCYSSAPNTKTLQVGDSCTYEVKIDYTKAVTDGDVSLPFTYNNGISSGQTTNVAADWSAYTPTPPVEAPIVTIEAVPDPIGDVMMGNSYQFTATISGTGSSTVSAAFENPAAGVITSSPSPCALDNA